MSTRLYFLNYFLNIYPTIYTIIPYLNIGHVYIYFQQLNETKPLKKVELEETEQLEEFELI